MLQTPNAGVGTPTNVGSSGTLTVPATVNVGDLLYLTGIDSADKADNTSASTMPAVAVCVGKQSSTTAEVIYFGEVNLYTGLTPGTIQYVGINGGLTETPPVSPDVSQQVGEALNTTTLVFNPAQVVAGGGHINWTQDEYVPTFGQVTFILSSAPIDVTSLEFNLNGVLYDDNVDYTISGSTITWISSITLKPKDKILIRYQ